MSGPYTVTFEDLEAFSDALGRFPGDLEAEINEVLHGDAGEKIQQKIDPKIQPSNRRFKGHRSGAKGSAWASYDKTENMAVTTRPKASRRYLYFPDDGSDTLRHFGNQQFFPQGLEDAAPEICDDLLNAMERKMKEM